MQLTLIFVFIISITAYAGNSFISSGYSVGSCSEEASTLIASAKQKAWIKAVNSCGLAYDDGSTRVRRLTKWITNNGCAISPYSTDDFQYANAQATFECIKDGEDQMNQ